MENASTDRSITQGLKTKADKIRALALAGYDRIEIAQYLNIRYQHVRKVPLDSALGVGLRRQVIAEREPVSPYL